MTDMPRCRRHSPISVVAWPKARRLPGRDTLAVLAAPFIGVARVVARWRRREVAISELARLDDMTLVDIGLRRGEIRSAVIEAQESGWPAERRRCR